MDLLYDGKAEEFIDNLKGLKFRKKKRAVTLKKMRYDEYRNKGYQLWTPLFIAGTLCSV